MYDWDNKTLNTSTTNNTSQKAFLVKDKLKKEINIYDNNHNNFIDIKDVFDNEINEFDEKIDKPKIDKIGDNKYSIKALNTNEGFYNSQIIRSNIKKLIFKTEENNNYFKKYKENEKEKNNDEEDNDLDFNNFMEMTEEGKAEDIKRCPNYSGVIHSKRQLEKKNITKKSENDDKCIII